MSDKSEDAMTHKEIQDILEYDLSCAICQDVYINPLILNCSHTFCKFCVYRWLSKKTGCPQCRITVCFQAENLALRNIINRLVQKASSQFQLNRTNCVNQRLKDEEEQEKEEKTRTLTKDLTNNQLMGRFRAVTGERDRNTGDRGSSALDRLFPGTADYHMESDSEHGSDEAHGAEIMASLERYFNPQHDTEGSDTEVEDDRRQHLNEEGEEDEEEEEEEEDMDDVDDDPDFEESEHEGDVTIEIYSDSSNSSSSSSSDSSSSSSSSSSSNVSNADDTSFDDLDVTGYTDSDDGNEPPRSVDTSSSTDDDTSGSNSIMYLTEGSSDTTEEYGEPLVYGYYLSDGSSDSGGYWRGFIDNGSSDESI
mgnify:CR=1 FL=1